MEGVTPNDGSGGMHAANIAKLPKLSGKQGSRRGTLPSSARYKRFDPRLALRPASVNRFILASLFSRVEDSNIGQEDFRAGSDPAQTHKGKADAAEHDKRHTTGAPWQSASHRERLYGG
jgi:hypothetical protein